MFVRICECMKRSGAEQKEGEEQTEEHALLEFLNKWE